MSSNESIVAPSDQDTRKSLILAGGGMRVAYQTGVIMALQESGLKFTHIDGTSGGIFNTAMLASGLTPYEMADCWRGLKMKSFVSLANTRDYLKPLQMKGYTDADNIRNRVFPQLKIDLASINKNKQINATFNVCNFSDKAVEAISNREVTEDHLIAGVSLPMVMPAIKIQDTWYTDAVWIKDANLLEGARQQSEELWLVWVIGNCKSYLPGALNQYVHMIEMSANGALLEEYKQIQNANDAIPKNESAHEQQKPVKLFVIKPEFPVPLDTDLFINKIDSRSLINMGYADARRCLSSMSQAGIEMNQEATKMRDPGTRLNFRGTFEGKASWQGTATSISLHTYFSFQQLADDYIMDLYSSIHVAAWHREISLYDHRVRTTKHKQYTLLEADAKLYREGKVYDVNIAWKLFSPIDFLIGLEFKQATITISLDDAEIMKGSLYQSMPNRLRGCYTTNVRTESGGVGGIKKRYSMISKLITHGI